MSPLRRALPSFGPRKSRMSHFEAHSPSASLSISVIHWVRSPRGVQVQRIVNHYEQLLMRNQDTKCILFADLGEFVTFPFLMPALTSLLLQSLRRQRIETRSRRCSRQTGGVNKSQHFFSRPNCIQNRLRHASGYSHPAGLSLQVRILSLTITSNKTMISTVQT